MDHCDRMKWLDDPPERWSDAPDDPPRPIDPGDPVHARCMSPGIVVREPGSDEAYLYAGDGGVTVEEFE